MGHLSIPFFEVLLVFGIEIHNFTELSLFILLSLSFYQLFLIKLVKDFLTFLSFRGHSRSLNGITFGVLLPKVICKDPGTALSISDLLLFFVIVYVVYITAVNAKPIKVIFISKLHCVAPHFFLFHLPKLFVLDEFVLGELVFDSFFLILRELLQVCLHDIVPLALRDIQLSCRILINYSATIEPV